MEPRNLVLINLFYYLLFLIQHLHLIQYKQMLTRPHKAIAITSGTSLSGAPAANSETHLFPLQLLSPVAGLILNVEQGCRSGFRQVLIVLIIIIIICLLIYT